MKNVTLTCLLFCLFYSKISFGQFTHILLDANNSSVTLNNSGTQFYDYNNFEAGYNVPKSPLVPHFERLQFWFQGIDSNNQIHSCLGGNDVGSDLEPGPIQFDISEQNQTWIYNITQSEIENYHNWWYQIITYGSNTDPNIQTPSEKVKTIVNHWPKCFDFVDINVDGEYHKEDGDFPIIKGCNAVFMIQNDSIPYHTYSGGVPIGLNTYYLFYQFSQASYLDEVTFIDICGTNKSSNIYTDFDYGMVLSETGNVNIPLFGCDSSKNIAYIYSRYNYNSAYNLNPPSLGVVDLNNSTSYMQPFNGFPSSQNEVSNLLNGKKKNGTDWLDLNGTPTKFAFSGNPNLSNSWNQISFPDPNQSGEYEKFIIGKENLTLFPNESFSSSYAIVYSRESDHLSNVNFVLNLADSVRWFYTQHKFETCENGYLELDNIKTADFVIFPNPTNDFIHFPNISNDVFSITIMNHRGEIVLKNSNTKTIDVSAFSPGFYTVVFQTSSNQLVRKMIIGN